MGDAYGNQGIAERSVRSACESAIEWEGWNEGEEYWICISTEVISVLIATQLHVVFPIAVVSTTTRFGEADRRSETWIGNANEMKECPIKEGEINVTNRPLMSKWRL